MLTAAFFLSSAWSFPTDPPGKTIFQASKCSNCHSIKAQGVTKVSSDEAKEMEKTPPDLSAVGTKHTPDWITKFLLKKETLNDKKHLKKFKGSEEELQTLATWLGSLKSK